MEQALSGRGKMGSLVGASEEVRRAGGVDSSMNDYAVSFFFWCAGRGHRSALSELVLLAFESGPS